MSRRRARPTGPRDAARVDEALFERLLDGAEPVPAGRPTGSYWVLQQVIDNARAPATAAELADDAEIRAAFRAVRAGAPVAARRRARHARRIRRGAIGAVLVLGGLTSVAAASGGLPPVVTEIVDVVTPFGGWPARQDEPRTRDHAAPPDVPTRIADAAGTGDAGGIGSTPPAARRPDGVHRHVPVVAPVLPELLADPSAPAAAVPRVDAPAVLPPTALAPTVPTAAAPGAEPRPDADATTVTPAPGAEAVSDEAPAAGEPPARAAPAPPPPPPPGPSPPEAPPAIPAAAPPEAAPPPAPAPSVPAPPAVPGRGSTLAAPPAFEGRVMRDAPVPEPPVPQISVLPQPATQHVPAAAPVPALPQPATQRSTTPGADRQPAASSDPSASHVVPAALPTPDVPAPRAGPLAGAPGA
jgi:hypothetical protein